MKLFNHYKKIFGVMGVTVLLIPLLFSLKPQKAEAIVPVNDFELNLTADILLETEMQGWGSYETKEFTWDTILWVLAKALLHQVTQSVVRWISTGFQGNPLFVTDLKRFAYNTVNEAVGIFMDEYLDPDVYDLLCGPWKNPVFFALLSIQAQSDKYKPECTLDVLINNAQGMANFMNSFLNGGWKAFTGLVARPENNAYGAYLVAMSKMEEAQGKAAARAETEANMNNGFLGMKICLSRTASGLCEDWQIESPGSWVEDELAWNTTSEIRSLEIADEIDEVLGALAGVIMKWAIQGIAGSGTGPPPGPAPAPAMAKQTH